MNNPKMNMKCPFCVEEGKKSTLQDYGERRTLLGHTPYYDENGVYHNHDPNMVSHSYGCSNGHEFTTKERPPCPNCNYGVHEREVMLAPNTILQHYPLSNGRWLMCLCGCTVWRHPRKDDSVLTCNVCGREFTKDEINDQGRKLGSTLPDGS